MTAYWTGRLILGFSLPTVGLAGKRWRRGALLGGDFASVRLFELFTTRASWPIGGGGGDAQLDLVFTSPRLSPLTRGLGRRKRRGALLDGEFAFLRLSPESQRDDSALVMATDSEGAVYRTTELTSGPLRPARQCQVPRSCAEALH